MFLAAQIVSLVNNYVTVPDVVTSSPDVVTSSPDVVTSPASVDDGWMTLSWVPPGSDPDLEADLTELDVTTGTLPAATGDSSSDPISVVIPALVVAVTLLVIVVGILACILQRRRHRNQAPHENKDSKNKDHTIVDLPADIDSASSSSSKQNGRRHCSKHASSTSTIGRVTVSNGNAIRYTKSKSGSTSTVSESSSLQFVGVPTGPVTKEDTPLSTTDPKNHQPNGDQRYSDLLHPPGTDYVYATLDCDKEGTARYLLPSPKADVDYECVNVPSPLVKERVSSQYVYEDITLMLRDATSEQQVASSTVPRVGGGSTTIEDNILYDYVDDARDDRPVFDACSSESPGVHFDVANGWAVSQTAPPTTPHYSKVNKTKKGDQVVLVDEPTHTFHPSSEGNGLPFDVDKGQAVSQTTPPTTPQYSNVNKPKKGGAVVLVDGRHPRALLKAIEMSQENDKGSVSSTSQESDLSHDADVNNAADLYANVMSSVTSSAVNENYYINVTSQKPESSKSKQSVADDNSGTVMASESAA